MTGSRAVRRLAAAAGLGILLAACSDTASIREASTAPPLTAARVDVTLTGDAGVTIPDPTHDVTFRLDDARLLAIDLVVHSQARASQTAAVKATLFDASGLIIGDASGGSTALQPGQDGSFRLTGPLPTGTIAKATFEVHLTTVPASH